MPKRPHDSSNPSKPRDMTPVWEARGYKEDLANTKHSSQEDPKGEQAYQKAFAEAAKSNPPRVPDPQWYPNSPSAREYIQKRNQKFFSHATDSRVPSAAYIPPVLDIHRRTSDDKRNASTSVSPQPQQQPHQSNTINPFAILPSTMEPKMNAPSGPTKRIR